MRIWTVIPAYNEEKSLGALLERLAAKGISTLVVDDGSCDNTFAVANEKATITLRNEKNLGKGIALRHGIIFLLKNKDFDYIITMDADSQHSPQDIDSFFEEAGKGEAFVIGNRMNNPMGMSPIRIKTNRIMSQIISKIAKQEIPDTQCGFRLIRKDVLERIQTETNKFEIESEMIVKAAKNNFTIKSIPIKSIYFKNNPSKINPFIDTLRFVRFILRLKR